MRTVLAAVVARSSVSLSLRHAKGRGTVGGGLWFKLERAATNYQEQYLLSGTVKGSRTDAVRNSICCHPEFVSSRAIQIAKLEVLTEVSAAEVCCCQAEISARKWQILRLAKRNKCHHYTHGSNTKINASARPASQLTRFLNKITEITTSSLRESASIAECSFMYR